MKQASLNSLMGIKNINVLKGINTKLLVISIPLLTTIFISILIPLKSQSRLEFGVFKHNQLYANSLNEGQKKYCFLKIRIDRDSVERICGNLHTNALIDIRSYGWDVLSDGYVMVIIQRLTRRPSEAFLMFGHQGAASVSFRIPPVGNWVRMEEWESKENQEIYWPSALDVTAAHDTLWLLHRRNRAIDLWQGKAVVVNDSLIDYTWEHQHTYLADSTAVVRQFSYANNRLEPIANRFSRASIPESYIRAARLKLIRQGGNFFVINLSHGEIYHLGEKITLVGLLEKGNQPWIKNYFEHALLIENRDRNVLMTAQPVRRISSEGAFPVFEIN